MSDETRRRRRSDIWKEEEITEELRQLLRDDLVNPAEKAGNSSSVQISEGLLESIREAEPVPADQKEEEKQAHLELEDASTMRLKEKTSESIRDRATAVSAGEKALVEEKAETEKPKTPIVNLATLTTEKTDAPRYAHVQRWRHENKYRINCVQESKIAIRAAGVMMRDPHVQADGTYLIRSLYFDDMYDSCLTDNLAGADPRSKFRIRYYNSNPEWLTLEKKIKERGMCLKQDCRLTWNECHQLMQGQIPTILPDMPEAKQRLLAEMQIRGLRPRTIVTYERVPFVYSGGNVRVTFDRKITSSEDIERFLEGDYRQRPILPMGESILEVKWDEVMPKHIKDTLRVEGLQWVAFSKYFLCRMLPG